MPVRKAALRRLAQAVSLRLKDLRLKHHRPMPFFQHSSAATMPSLHFCAPARRHTLSSWTSGAFAHHLVFFFPVRQGLARLTWSELPLLHKACRW